MPVRTRCAVVLLALVSLLLPLVPGHGRDLLQTAVQAGCLALAWHHLRRRRHVIGLGWGLLVVAVSVLALSDLVAVLEQGLWSQTSAASPSNLVALCGYLLLGWSVLRLDRHRSREGRRLPGRIEAAIFGAGVLTPMLVFLGMPILHSDVLSVQAKAVATAYALADLVIVTVIARLLLTDGSQSRSFTYLTAALFTSLAGDAWSWAVSGEGPVAVVSGVQVLWLFAFVLFASGVAHPSMETFISGGAWSQSAPRQRRVWLMGAGQAMPALTLLLVQAFHVRASLLVIAVGGLAVSLLVAARMNGLLDRISEQSSQLSDLARSDDLTGLHNRRSWNFELARACKSAAASLQPLNVALLDLDHFKRYNDSYGHPAGDRLLHAATQAWRSGLRPGEVLARYGGEEFAMLLPGISLEDAVARVDALRELTPGGQSFSAGVAVWAEGTDPERAVADADAALYQAKRQGRDRVVAFRPPADPAGTPQAAYGLRTLVQPIVRVQDLVVVGYEALTRFDPSTDALGVFAQAHQDGYGDVLEGSAILGALRVPARPDDIRLFLNVSARAMRSPQFWRTLPERLDGVVMELHEDRDRPRDPGLPDLLDRFRDRGARICLDGLVASEDDLERIVSLRPDMVKVDRSLVRGCDVDPERAAETARVVSFAQAYGVAVCAVGVETTDELLSLRSMGVPYVQGHLLGRPEPHWVEPLQPTLRVGALPQWQPRAAAAVSATAAR
jgi:diguanylate cyclase (GGDEF)-like protein